MSYPLFELLALTVGTISILVSIVTTLWSGQSVVETVAQGLLLVVLVGAVHRGKRGGLLAAAFATVAYAGLRVPMIVRHGLSPDVAGLMLVRTATYALIGIGGGIVCSRIREFLARLEGTSNLDPVTRLFNQRFVARTLQSAILQYERYGTTFSVVALTMGGFDATDPGTDQRRTLKTVAGWIRDHVRLVDEAARLDDGRILVVMPHTGGEGAGVVANRLHAGVQRLLGATGEDVSALVLTADHDLGALRELAGAPSDEREEPQARVA